MMQDRTARSFAERVQLLIDFSTTSGRLPRRPAHDVPEAEGYLGRVVNRLRDSYRLGKLSGVQITWVEAVPNWQWKAPGKTVEAITPKPADLPEGFKLRLDEIRAFAARTGSIPIRHGKSLEERRGAEWCRTQRARRAGTYAYGSPLSPAEKSALEDIEGWFWEREPAGTIWRARYDAYLDFTLKNGRRPSRAVKDREQMSLHYWGNTQKAKYQNSMLPPHTPTQMGLLEAIPGWTWARCDTPVWEERHAEFEAFYAAQQTMPSDRAEDPAEQKLCRWAVTQRNEYVKGIMRRLHPERVEILNDTPGWAWVIDPKEKWLLSYAEVFSYTNVNGKFPSQHSADPQIAKLGTWCGHNRRARIAGKTFMTMNPGRVAALNLIPGWYWVGDEADFTV